MANRISKPLFCNRLDGDRDLIERFFWKMKYWRRGASYYVKLVENFLALIQPDSLRARLHIYWDYNLILRIIR